MKMYQSREYLWPDHDNGLRQNKESIGLKEHSENSFYIASSSCTKTTGWFIDDNIPSSTDDN